MIKLRKHLPLEVTGEFGLMTFLVNKFIDRIGQPCGGVSFKVMRGNRAQYACLADNGDQPVESNMCIGEM